MQNHLQDPERHQRSFWEHLRCVLCNELSCGWYVHSCPKFLMESIKHRFLAFNFSGGYFNPALATSLKFGCEGNSFEEHMVVYWLGATAGAIASVYFYKLPFVQKSLKQYGPKEE